MSEVVEGTVKLDRQLSALIDAADGRQVQNALMGGGQVIETAAKQNITKNGLVLTGTLRRGVNTVAENTHSVIIGVFGVIYAAIHEFGGVIRPKNGPYLRFKGKDGQWATVSKVTIRAKPYIRPAFDENKTRVIDQIRRSLLDQLRKVAS